MAAMKEIWNKALDIMEPQTPASAFGLWLKQIRPVELTGEALTLSVPSAFYYEIIKAKYYKMIRDAMTEVIGFELEINLQIDADMDADTAVAERAESSIESLTLEESYTFSNFVVGNSNRFAYAASQQVAANPAKQYNPLFLYGGSGLGKTHLMYAIIDAVREKHPDYNILYVDSEEFTNELIGALRDGSMQEFREKYRATDMFLVDDIQFIGGKERSSEEFFHTFEALMRDHKQVVLASDRPPRDIQQLDERLKSRFENGLMADIQPPDYELRLAIINKKADALDLSLPEDVGIFLADRLKSNVRQLEGALKKIKAVNLINKQPPSIAVAQSAVQDVLNTNEPVDQTIDRIITEVAHYYHISADDIKSKKRTASITIARQVSMYVIREVCQLSLPTIGDQFEGRDHSTVHHSIKKVELMMATDRSFKNTIENLIRTVKEK